MFKIYETILSLYKERFSKSTAEFKAGFEMALLFLEIGIKKSTSYNANYQLEMLTRKQRKLVQENNFLQIQLDAYKDELNRRDLVSIKTIGNYREFILETAFGDFSIVINANKETLMAVWFMFLMKTEYHTVEECKTKFMGFLQQLKGKNLIVYKDIKTAKREVLNNDSRQNKQGSRS